MRPKFPLRLAKLWLAALVLTLAAAPVFAEAAPVCKGRDLLNSPDVKPDLVAHADDLVNGEGLLWKVERAGIPPSYLYGTIHSTNAAAIALAAEAAVFIDDAKSMATELGGPFDSSAKIDLGAAMLAAALSPDQDTLAAVLPAADAEVVETFLAEHGYPKEMTHHLKLWFLAAAAALPACEAEGAKQDLPEVDQFLAERGKAHGLTVVGLETAAEQMQTLESVPASLAATILLATARAPDLNDDAYVTLLNLYRQKRPALAIAILDAMPGLSQQERAAEAEFTRLLLVGRNETMMKRAAPLLAEGGAFIAVGALHLSGKGGLIELMRGAGYRVEKVW